MKPKTEYLSSDWARLVLLALLFTLGACSGKAEAPDQAEVLVSTPLALNSMEYCEKLGYTTEARKNTDCENFFACIFPDSSECHSGLFQQGLCGQEFTYCAQQGYQVEVVGSEVHCTFADGSYCTELDYLLGECQPGEKFP